MRSIREAAGTPLIWRSKGLLSGRSELFAGDEILARMRVTGLARRRGFAETAEGAWTLRRMGWLPGRVDVQREGSDRVVARYERGWIFAGSVELEKDPALHWRVLRLLPTEWGFLDADGDVQVRFRSGLGLFRTPVRMTIEPTGARLDALPALALLGWYLVLAARRRG